MKFSFKDFFGKCEQIRSFLRIYSYLLKKSSAEKVIVVHKSYLIFRKNAPFTLNKLQYKQIDIGMALIEI